MILVVAGGRPVREEADVRLLEIFVLVLLLALDDALQTVMPLVVDYIYIVRLRILVGELSEILPNNALLPVVDHHVKVGYGLVQVVL